MQSFDLQNLSEIWSLISLSLQHVHNTVSCTSRPFVAQMDVPDFILHTWQRTVRMQGAEVKSGTFILATDSPDVHGAAQQQPWPRTFPTCRNNWWLQNYQKKAKQRRRNSHWTLSSLHRTLANINVFSHFWIEGNSYLIYKHQIKFTKKANSIPFHGFRKIFIEQNSIRIGMGSSPVS